MTFIFVEKLIKHYTQLRLKAPLTTAPHIPWKTIILFLLGVFLKIGIICISFCNFIFSLKTILEIPFFKNKFIYLFLAALALRCCVRAFLQLRRVGATLSCGAWASYCGGFSCCRARALGTRASVVVAHRLSSCCSGALEHRLSSCGAQPYLLCGMWDLPGPGLKPVSPALAGGFLTTAPPGKPWRYFYNSLFGLNPILFHSWILL